MIRKKVCEAVRKTGEEEVYEDDERAQGKTLKGTVCLTCQYDKGSTQVTAISIWNTFRTRSLVKGPGP